MNNELILGIDEAGMGPVFGPLIVSGVVIKKNSLTFLKEIGVRDSKKFGLGLSAHFKRQQIWEEARSHIISEKQIVIDAEELDRSNMYKLHIGATRRILEALKWRKIKTVYIEQLGQLRKEVFLNQLGFCHSGFVYETKADIKYVAVSLASIGAKILRDRKVKELCELLNEDYISGYPNGNTERFLRNYYSRHGCLPPGTRVTRKWKPIEEMRR